MLNDRLTDLASFGPNPGALRARLYIPADLAPGAPLVVALHGCTQDAATYDAGSGWSTLADRAGFALLLPEQVRGNNANGCFNWFEPADIARQGGEAESIAAMVKAAIAGNRLDPARVFITGLSAGGAMTAAMLATWPELFAGGAIIGGLPYACATGVPEALARMRAQGGADDAGLVGAVRRAGNRPARWPAVSIWHGSADATVNIANMDALGRQWRGIHDVAGAPTVETGRNWVRSSWRLNGRPAVEEWRVTGMGHGVPIDPRGPDRLGRAGPHFLDVGLASTALIAHGWDLIADAPVAAAERSSPAAAVPASGVNDVIERALRQAGLMR